MRPLSCYSACLVFALLGLATPLRAQTPPDTLITDRPGFTETTDVVGRGIVQIEMGSSVELDGHGGTRTRVVTAPLGLVRVGLTPRVELRVGDDGEIVSAIGRGPGHTTIAGGADVEVGLKWAMLDRSPAFRVALIPLLSIPIGSSATSSGTYDPTAEVSWATSLVPGFDVGGNVNLSRLHGVERPYVQEAISLSVSRDWAGTWGSYWEAYGLMDLGHHQAQAWSFDTGISHTVGANLEVDIEMGHSLTAAAPDWFFGVGMGFRARPPRHGR